MPIHLETTLAIHEGDKIFSKLLSRETSAVSSRPTMYYGRVQSSIPFGWESQPGTPKKAASEATNPNDIILTLTLPPSLHCSPSSSSSSSSGSPKRPNRTKLIKNDTRMSGSSSSSLSSLSLPSSWSGPVLSSSAPALPERHRRHRLTGRNYYENIDYPKCADFEFSSAANKFIGARKRVTVKRLKDFFAATTLKRAVLAVVGRRSENRDT